MPLTSIHLLSDGYRRLLPRCKLDGAWSWPLTSLLCYIFTPHRAFTAWTGTSPSRRCVEENVLTLAPWGLLLISKYAFHMSWHPVPFVVRGWRGSQIPCWMLTYHSARVTYVTQPVLYYSTAMLLGDTSNFEWYELHITSGFNVTPDCTTGNISWLCAVKTAAPPTHYLLKTPSVAHHVKTFYKVKPQNLSVHFVKTY